MMEREDAPRTCADDFCNGRAIIECLELLKQ